MNSAPEGKPAPVVERGEFPFAAIALDHAHIYGQCRGLTEAGGEPRYVYDPDPAKVDHARLQVAGLIWEKGKGNYGTVPDEEAKALFARSQEQCRILMERPEATAETRAIAELIFLEDDYFMGQYESAYTPAGAYMEKWGKVKAEVVAVPSPPSWSVTVTLTTYSPLSVGEKVSVA